MDLVSRLPEPFTVMEVALRLKLIQETAGVDQITNSLPVRV